MEKSMPDMFKLQGLPSMGGIARTVSANGVAPTGFPIPQAQAMPPPAAVNQVSRPLNIAQMQEMLRTGTFWKLFWWWTSSHNCLIVYNDN